MVAVGELGYDEQTALEDRYLRAQIELAKEYEMPIMVHTPHRDKKRGTFRTMDVLKEHGFNPAHCVIDHNNEETVEDVLARGYWVAFSIYPHTKMGNERMTEIVRRYGPERLIAIPLATGASPTRSPCPKPRGSWPSAASRQRRSAPSPMGTRSRPTVSTAKCAKSTGRTRRRSTSARSSRATRSCVAAKRQ